MLVSNLVGVQNPWLVMVLMMAGHTEAASVQLAWDPPAAPAVGYKLYYGQNSRNYRIVVDVGGQTSYTLSGLDRDRDYYFTVTAYDDRGNESSFANEVSAFLTATTAEPMESVDPRAIPPVINTYPVEPVESQAILPSVQAGRRNGDETEAWYPTTSYRWSPGSSVSLDVPHVASGRIESGEIVVDHQWKRVGFRKTFVDPIVVAKARSMGQAHSVVSRIHSVDVEGFEVRLRLWDEMENFQSAQSMGYLVIERGEYALPNGILLEAGSIELEGTNSVRAVEFNQRFAETPVVIASIANTPESEAVRARPIMIGKHGFRLLTETASRDQHTATPVRVDYIAWEPSWATIDELTFEVSKYRHPTDDVFQTIRFQQTFEETPVFLTDLQELQRGNALGVSWDDKNQESVEVSISSDDAVTTQTVRRGLQIGYMAVQERLFD